LLKRLLVLAMLAAAVAAACGPAGTPTSTLTLPTPGTSVTPTEIPADSSPPTESTVPSP